VLFRSQLPQGHHLCINCIVLGQGRNLVAPLALISWAKKVRSEERRVGKECNLPCCVKGLFYVQYSSSLLYKLSELQFLISLIKLNASFLTNRKFKVSSPRKVASGVPHGSVLAPVLYSLYINDAPAAPGIHLALFADGTCVYATEKHELRVLNNLQRGLTAMGSWCHCWNIQSNEGKTEAICFARRRRMLGEDL
jgi:hypothetical protein